MEESFWKRFCTCRQTDSILNKIKIITVINLAYIISEFHTIDVILKCTLHCKC